MARSSEPASRVGSQSLGADAARVGDCEMSNSESEPGQIHDGYPAVQRGIDVVALPASLGDDVTGPFGQRLHELARRPGGQLLILDASDTADVSVRGLALIVAVSRIARSRGGRVRVINASSGLQALLCAAGADECK